jgi:hypothetical protein
MTFFLMLLSLRLVCIFRNFRKLNRSINIPIYRLKTMGFQIAQGIYPSGWLGPRFSELDELTDSSTPWRRSLAS